MLDGQALKIVKPYFIMADSRFGLQEAMKILEITYGSRYKQCKAQLKQLHARPKVEATELGLVEFYSELHACQVVLEAHDSQAVLDSEHNLKCLLQKLPEEIQDSWEMKVDSTPDGKPSYVSLMEVIHDEYKKRCRILYQWKEEDLSLSDNYDSRTKLDENHKCLCGPDGPSHRCLADCYKYSCAQDANHRWSLLVGRGACFRCLRFGHRANSCPLGQCELAGCVKYHHPSLHCV